MFGRLRYTPDEYYRMGFMDMLTAIDGYNDANIDELNRFRHLIAAPAWAMGGKINVKQVMPLPIDKVATEQETMSKDEFLMLAKMYRIKAKA